MLSEALYYYEYRSIPTPTDPYRDIKVALLMRFQRGGK
jgi:hypothetical protein